MCSKFVLHLWGSLVSFHSVLLLRSINVTVLLLHCALCLFCAYLSGARVPLFRPLMFTRSLRDKLPGVSIRTLRVPDGASWIQEASKLFGSASPSCSLQTEAAALFFGEFFHRSVVVSVPSLTWKQSRLVGRKWGRYVGGHLAAAMFF